MWHWYARCSIFGRCGLSRYWSFASASFAAISSRNGTFPHVRRGAPPDLFEGFFRGALFVMPGYARRAEDVGCRRYSDRVGKNAQHFEQGSNWKAKNVASIKLRASDRRAHPVTVTKAETELSEEELAEALRRRERAKAQLEARQQAAAAAARTEALARQADKAAAERDRAPEGWVPANRRAFTDPLSRAADPRLGKAPQPKKGKKRRPLLPGN